MHGVRSRSKRSPRTRGNRQENRMVHMLWGRGVIRGEMQRLRINYALGLLILRIMIINFVDDVAPVFFFFFFFFFREHATYKVAISAFNLCGNRLRIARNNGVALQTKCVSIA